MDYQGIMCFSCLELSLWVIYGLSRDYGFFLFRMVSTGHLWIIKGLCVFPVQNGQFGLFMDYQGIMCFSCSEWSVRVIYGLSRDYFFSCLEWSVRVIYGISRDYVFFLFRMVSSGYLWIIKGLCVFLVLNGHFGLFMDFQGIMCFSCLEWSVRVIYGLSRDFVFFLFRMVSSGYLWIIKGLYVFLVLNGQFGLFMDFQGIMCFSCLEWSV